MKVSNNKLTNIIPIYYLEKYLICYIINKLFIYIYNKFYFIYAFIRFKIFFIGYAYKIALLKT